MNHTPKLVLEQRNARSKIIYFERAAALMYSISSSSSSSSRRDHYLKPHQEKLDDSPRTTRTLPQVSVSLNVHNFCHHTAMTKKRLAAKSYTLGMGVVRTARRLGPIGHPS